MFAAKKSPCAAINTALKASESKNLCNIGVNNGGGWYHQSVTGAVNNDGDAMVVLDVLARQVGIRGIFSDWPATVTYYDNCMNK